MELDLIKKTKGKFKEIAKEASKKLVLLTYTHEITSKDAELFAKFAWLTAQYSDYAEENSKIKAMITILNSILYQSREYFCITRNQMKSLIMDDKNWKTQNTFNEKNYGEVLFLLMNG